MRDFYEGWDKLTAEADKVMDDRAGVRQEMWRRDGALVPTIYATGKLRRILVAMTTPGADWIKVFWQEAPDALNYLRFAAQAAWDCDLNGDWPLGQKEIFNGSSNPESGGAEEVG